ncbi:hypothetical protein A1Q2_02728 [Trichosporon asahii var. asahii CBS 8904]|uniref:Uncharacterized protein n=1 Tax=Trichosporon asahii var. asahii (strain CBS 8904) TaxID=1220162 RepID=K1VQW1_TRIAC|nr:hypothetical protein A1Q2_02728 [Trichosporon asahii var. asahii CBS 8904]
MNQFRMDHHQQSIPFGVDDSYRWSSLARAPARLPNQNINRWAGAPNANDYQRSWGPSSAIGTHRSHAADKLSIGTGVRPGSDRIAKLPSVTSGKSQRLAPPLSVRVLSATHSASLMSSPCTPDVVGESFTPGGLFDDADDEWDGLPITPAEQQGDAMATPESDGWRSASCICSDKSSSGTTFAGMATPSATAPLPTSTSEGNAIGWPLHRSVVAGQAKHVLSGEPTQKLDLASSNGCAVTPEIILGNVGSHEKVEADEKLQTDLSSVVPAIFCQPTTATSVDAVEDCDAIDEIIIVSTPPIDLEEDAAEILEGKRVVISEAHACAHDLCDCVGGGNSASPTEIFGRVSHHDVNLCHSTGCDQQFHLETCDAVTHRPDACNISSAAFDDFPAESTFLPANFFDDDDASDTVNSDLTSLVNVQKPALKNFGLADTSVGPVLSSNTRMHFSAREGLPPSSAWQLDYSSGSADPIPELVDLSPAAAQLFKVLGIATEPSDDESSVCGKDTRSLLASDAAPLASPVSWSSQTSEDGRCPPSLSTIHSFKSEELVENAVNPSKQPATSSIAVTAVDESLLFTDASFATGCSELAAPQPRPIPNYLSSVTAGSDFRHLLGHWLASYVIGRLAHREAVGSGNIASEWTRQAVYAREMERTQQVPSSNSEYTFYSPRPTPRAVDRTSGRFADDPYDVLKRHGIATAAPNMAFVQIVTEFIVRRRIPAETIVAAAWFVDNLPVHDVDGDLGFSLRGALCVSNGEPFAVERRLAMIALYLADMSISDFNYNLASWSNAFGVPKANAVCIEREALASLGYSVSIPIQSWRDHCKNVYSLFTRATFLPGVSTLSLGTMHTMVQTARGVAEDAAEDVEIFRRRQKTDLDNDAIASLRRFQSHIDVSKMPMQAPLPTCNSVYHTPDSDQENVAPPPAQNDEDEEEEEFAPYDGAPSFPVPKFPKQVEAPPPGSALPTPPYDGADSFPEPVFENNDGQDNFHKVTLLADPSPKAKVADWLHHDQDDDEDDNSYEEYDGAAPFPDPVPLERKAPKYTMSMPVAISSLSRSPVPTQSHQAHVPKRARYASSPRHVPVASWPLDPSLPSRPPTTQQRMSYATLSRGYSPYYPQDQQLLRKTLSAQPKFFSSEAPHHLTREQLRSLAVEHHPRPVRAPYINGVAINHGRVDALEAAIEHSTKNFAHGYPTDHGLASEALLPTLITAIINAAAELEPLKEAPEPVARPSTLASMTTVA